MRMSLRCNSRVPSRLAVLASLLYAGCAVGPNFKSPAAPDVKDYTVSPLRTTVATANVTGGEAQSFAQGNDLSADWWLSLIHI